MFTLSRPEVAKVKMRQNFQISYFKKTGKPIAPCDRTALEASFHSILFTDLKLERLFTQTPLLVSSHLATKPSRHQEM